MRIRFDSRQCAVRLVGVGASRRRPPFKGTARFGTPRPVTCKGPEAGSAAAGPHSRHLVGKEKATGAMWCSRNRALMDPAHCQRPPRQMARMRALEPVFRGFRALSPPKRSRRPSQQGKATGAGVSSAEACGAAAEDPAGPTHGGPGYRSLRTPL